MNIINEAEIETCRSPKRLKTCEVKEDFISKLPDSILLHILSFLPLRDAIKTVLLRRFGKLWLHMPVLDLDNCLIHQFLDEDDFVECDYENFMDIIHQVSNHHNSMTLDKLRLKALNFLFTLVYSENEQAFNPAFGDPEGEAYEKVEREKEKTVIHQIDKLIGYALRRKVQILDLNFRGCDTFVAVGTKFYELPDVSSNCLTDLRLVGCDIRSEGKINLQGLRVLFLNKVSLYDEAMKNILLGCPSLEDLSLVNCYDLGQVNCENPNLKKVMICLNGARSRLYLSCPHVVSLEIAGWIERATLFNVSSLVDVSISFSALLRCEKRIYADVWWLLLKVRCCESFTPCSWTILVLSIWNLESFPCPLFKWKNIVLKLGLSKWHLPGLCSLFKGCPSIETLTMYISRGWDHFFQSDPKKWICEYDFDGEKYWDSHEATFPCLESIMVYGHINEPYVIQMVKFLLKNAPKLQQMEISTKKTLEGSVTEDIYTSEQLLQLSQKLLTFPRASPKAMIYVS